MSPLYNADGTPYVSTPRYTVKDPHFQLTSCGPCRFVDHAECIRALTITSGPGAGVLVCQCCGISR